jgi:hypothetical protein
MIGHVSYTNPGIKVILPRWELSESLRGTTYRLLDDGDWIAIKVRLLHACEDIMSGKGVVGKVDGKFICTLCHDEAPDAAVLIWKLNQQGI